MERRTCPWAVGELYMQYHDEEWGVPLYDDDRLFEMLILEGMQAGLSWITILKKREAFREAFDGFDAKKVAAYGEEKIEQLMQNSAIIRNRRKITAAVGNAQAFLRIREREGSFAQYVWSFVEGKPICNAWERIEDMPCTTPVSERMSKALKSEGFRFVGGTICYSFMQAVGMVNDHMVWCDHYNPKPDTLR